MNRKKFFITTGFIIAAATALACGSNSNNGDNDDPISNSNNDENPPIEDVSLTECDVNEFNWPVATLEVINNSSKASSYSITVEITDMSDNRLEEVFTFIEALRPNQSTEIEAQGLEEVSGQFKCKLLTVERLSSEG